MKFESLVKLDSRLGQLEADVIEFAEVYGKLPERCANAAWYGYGPYSGKGFKPRVVDLVGCYRPRTLDDYSESVLGTYRAYDVVYDHLYELLPDCAGCGCM